MTIKRFIFLLLISVIIFIIGSFIGIITYEHFSDLNNENNKKETDNEYYKPNKTGDCYYGELESGVYEQVCN